MRPVLALEGVSKSFGAVAALRDVRLDLRSPARRTRSSARTAPASPLWSRSWPACTRRTPARCRSTAQPVRLRRPGRRPRRRHRGDLPGAHAVPRPVGRREHLHGPAAAAQPAAHRHRPRCGPGAAELFDRLGVHLDPDRPARGLSIADQQLVEIAKALSFDARVLVMDEPTAALSGVEVERLFAVARSLRDAGAAVLFISHRFDEVFALCERITVMRDGAVGRHRPHRRSSPSTRWSARMVGREVSALLPEAATPTTGDVRPRGARPDPARRSSTTSASPSAAARSSRWPAWSAPGAARWSGRCSASTGTTRARSWSTAGGSPPGSTAGRDRRRASRSCPRTGASRAW